MDKTCNTFLQEKCKDLQSVKTVLLCPASSEVSSLKYLSQHFWDLVVLQKMASWWSELLSGLGDESNIVM